MKGSRRNNRHFEGKDFKWPTKIVDDSNSPGDYSDVSEDDSETHKQLELDESLTSPRFNVLMKPKQISFKKKLKTRLAISERWNHIGGLTLNSRSALLNLASRFVCLRVFRFIF